MRKHPLLVLALSIVTLSLFGAIFKSHPATGAVRARNSITPHPDQSLPHGEAHTQSASMPLVGAARLHVPGRGLIVFRPSPPPSVGHLRSPAVRRVATAQPGDVWHALRACESGNDYGANTGNGYYGAYQFTLSTWHAIGLPGRPDEAPAAAQDAAARILLSRTGWRAWPVCAFVVNHG